MNHFVNENIVMQFYLEQMEQDNIIFLKNRAYAKEQIAECINQLISETKMNNKIQIATKLWKLLFDAAMSYIEPDKQGYDKIFNYFDAYVEFEELIFASDSFYRDHTLHCIWVYFLGEYLKRKEEFHDLFLEESSQMDFVNSLLEVFEYTNIMDSKNYRRLKDSLELSQKVIELDEAVRCISALTHDLGYPLKKIEKINKSMKKVLPYFAIHDFDDFSFNYTSVQQEFVNQFLDFISRSYENNINLTDENALNILLKTFELDSYQNIKNINKKILEECSQEDLQLLSESCNLNVLFTKRIADYAAFCNDFEEYKHGIMSAFLLFKNLRVFQRIDYDMTNNKLLHSTRFPDEKVLTLQVILSSIAVHTCETFRITSLTSDTFLTFVDELEEFSRISRASQNREYVEEFCDTALYMEDGWLNIIFEFNNDELDNLNPEISFKGRCKRFLTLFNIKDLSPDLKLRVSCVGKLPTNQNTYTLEIANKHADIMINGESQNIPQYLKSNQFFTKEEYAAM